MRRAWTGIGSVAAALALAASLLVTQPAPTPEAVPANGAAGTWTTNGVVWDMVRIGSTIYLGGEFSQVVAPDGTQSLPRANLAAISTATGQPLPWAPGTNGAVLALESSADGSRVFVGGHFTAIAGMARSRLASVRTADGTVDTAFTATTGGRVRSLLRQGNALFVGGEFGNVGSTQQRLVARVDARSGTPTPGWDPVLTGGAVRGMALSPDGVRLYLSGSFTSVDNGNNTRFAAAVIAGNGALSSWRARVDQPLFDIAAAGDAVYLAVGGPGIPNNRLQEHAADGGAERWRYIADGDLQDLEIWGDTLFVGGHWDTDFAGFESTMLAAVDLRDDHVLDWHPRVAGQYGVWKVLAGPEGVWIAGELTQVGDQRRPGFAFLPNASPQPATARLLVDRFGTWRYRTGSAPAGWNARSFADGGWLSGRTELGYGDGDEVTRIAGTRTVYLRRTFTVTDRNAWRDLRLRLLADGGAAVYLNGTEVARENLPSGPLTAATRASRSKWTRDERTYVTSAVASSLLVTGSNTLAVEVHASESAEDLSFALELLGTPQPSTIDLLRPGGTWRYRDSGVAPPAAWTSRSYDAGAWRQGRGQLGAGDGDEATRINRTNPTHVTDWFRIWFPLTGRSGLRWANLSLLADDGAVVYLNGTQVARDNLPGGTITATTRASAARWGTEERAWRTFPVPLHLLRDGTNVVAVEVHQVAAGDGDASFDLRVRAGT